MQTSNFGNKVHEGSLNLELLGGDCALAGGRESHSGLLFSINSLPGLGGSIPHVGGEDNDVEVLVDVVHDLGLEEGLGGVIHDLVAELGLGDVLPELLGAKNNADKIIDLNGTKKTGGTGIKQLRENIAESKLSYEIMDDAAQAFLKSKIMDNIHKYFYIIVFAAYMRDAAAKAREA